MSFGFHRDRERERRVLEAKEQQQQQRERERQRERMEKELHKQAIDQNFEESFMRNNYRQISEHKSASGFGGGSVPLTDQWNPPIMPVRGHNKNFRQPFSQQIMTAMKQQQRGFPSSQSQLLSQQRTAPPPQVQAIQPPPSSFSLEDAVQSNQPDRCYAQQPSGPSLQQMEQDPPATPGPFSLPGFASQAGLQGYANRAAQQQQQQQKQQQQP